MAFTHEMIAMQKKLNKIDHVALIPLGSEPHFTDKKFVDSLDANLQFCIDNNVMKDNFAQLATCDAILVLNKKRNNIDGYIGISALMEMAVVHYLGKKIFLLNSIPSYDEHRWAHEVSIMQPVILHGDLSKII